MAKSPVLTIYNCSNQMIPIQVRTPGGNFYTSEQQVQIGPGSKIEVPESHVLESQIANLQGRGVLKIIKRVE